MPKKSSQIFLPPMSIDLLEFVELCEESAHRNLSDSFRRGSLDVGKATAILATFVVSVVDGQIANYSRLHKYDPRWTNEIIQSAIRSAEGLISRISDRYNQFVTPQLERIISEHLKAKAKKKKEPTLPKSDHKKLVPLGTQIDSLRKECRMTVEELADALDVTPRSVYRHLSGEADPRPRQIAAYEKLFSQKLGKPVHLNTSA
jgi:DNA-binding XRE family transcriptional regulator